jgi:uncharacterized protein (DUF3084 family)
MDSSMGSRRRTGAPAAPAGAARVGETDSSNLATRVEMLATTCRRHEATLDALLEAMTKLHAANSGLRAENASLRTRNAVSMVERVRAMPRGRPTPQVSTGRTAS